MLLKRGLQVLLAGVLLQVPAAAAASEPPSYQHRLIPGFPLRVEVLSDAVGPLAYRARLGTDAWQPPTGDAVLLDEAWWTPLRPLEPVPVTPPPRSVLRRVRAQVAPRGNGSRPDRLTDAAMGDVTLDGEPDLVLSFRRPFRRTPINRTRPRSVWTDRYGLSAHVGIYRPDDLFQTWVAGTLTLPVTAVAACDGALAVAHGLLDEPGTVATGAWRWIEFGFMPLDPLPGPGTPACVDLDGDGRTEPAILERSDR